MAQNQRIGSLRVKSYWKIEALDRDGRVVWEDGIGNIMTADGLNYWLDLMFNSSSQYASWYIVPFSNNYTPLATDTYAAKGFTEYTNYTESTRQAFVVEAAAAGALSNASDPALFSITESVTVYGAALVAGGTAGATKGDSAGGGIMLCAAKFGAAQTLSDGITLRITCTVTAQDA